LGLVLGLVFGPRVLRSTRDLRRSRPGKIESWVTGVLFVLYLRAVLWLPEWLIPEPFIAIVLTGFGSLAYSLPETDRKPEKWPLAIRLMQLFAVMLLLSIAVSVIPGQLARALDAFRR